MKTSSLNATLEFFGQFGLKVLRHEEFPTGCEATCNGPYGGAWSKTIIGVGEYEESCSFALELVYNYGVSDYTRGNDLRYIAITEGSYFGPRELISFTPGNLYNIYLHILC